MVSFDFIKNADIFKEESLFEKALSELRMGNVNEVRGSIAYEHAPEYEIEFGIFYSKGDETFDLKVYYKGEVVVWKALAMKGMEITKYEPEINYKENRALDHLNWFFGKCPDDDTYAEIRRGTVRAMLDDNLTEEEFNDRCFFLNVLFNCNI